MTVDAANGIELRRIVVGYLDTNCWVLRALDGDQALIVDPGDEPGRIIEAVADLDVIGIVLTHAHADHALALTAVADTLSAPILSHPNEPSVWSAELEHLATHGHLDAGTATADLLAQGRPPRPDPALALWDGRFDQPIRDGDTLALGPVTVTVLHTPGHTPGSITLHVPGHLLTGDTLFPGGPGLTGDQWPLSSFRTIIDSVRRLLHDHADATVVHPGHGPDTTVATERPHLLTWQSRGW